MSDVQMPGTWHPAYEDHARMIRGWLADRPADYHLKLVYQKRPLVASFDKPVEPDADAHGVRVLTKKKAWGPAPFVGDARYQQAAYFWFIAADEFGHMVAGDAWLEIVDRDDPRRYGATSLEDR